MCQCHRSWRKSWSLLLVRSSATLVQASGDSTTDPGAERWRDQGDSARAVSVKGMYPAPHIHEHLATAY